MKILIIEGSQNPPTFIINLINGLLKNNIEVGLLGKQRNNNFIPETAIGFTRLVTDYSTFRQLRVTWDLLRALLKPHAFIKAVKNGANSSKGYKQRLLDIIVYTKVYAYNPDVIHFQWATHLVDFRKLLLAGEFKCVVSLRGMHINVSPILDAKLASSYRKMFPLVAGFHAVSNHIATEAEKYNVDFSRTAIIYSMLPDRIFNHFKKSTNPIRKPLSILSIGRFHWQKGYGYGIDAIYQLKLRGILAHYTIVAGNDIPEEYIYLVNKLNITDQIKFVDRIEYEQIPSLMSAHSVLLLPSIAEGIANVVLEAMAVGLPVISSDAGGMSEVIIDRVTGWLVPLANPVAISDAITGYLNTDEKALLEIRANAYNWVRENHDANKQIRKFVDFYHEVLSAKNITN